MRDKGMYTSIEDAPVYNLMAKKAHVACELGFSSCMLAENAFNTDSLYATKHPDPAEYADIKARVAALNISQALKIKGAVYDFRQHENLPARVCNERYPPFTIDYVFLTNLLQQSGGDAEAPRPAQKRVGPSL